MFETFAAAVARSCEARKAERASAVALARWPSSVPACHLPSAGRRLWHNFV